MLRIILMAMSRMRWNVESLKVMAGATVMLSPVWMPIGSKFSMEHTMVTLPLLSRSNSSSNSFQPNKALSIMTSWMGLRCKPRVSFSSNASLSYTTAAPAPPRV